MGGTQLSKRPRLVGGERALGAKARCWHLQFQSGNYTEIAIMFKFAT